jgi:threonyl-tRNA synthetase
VPFAAVVGDREVAAGTVSLRGRDTLRLPPLPLADALAHVAALGAIPT